MGAYNEVKASANCPNCGNTVTVDVQFKYGNTNGFRYNIGDRLNWGGNDIGVRGVQEVNVEGEAVLCPICGYEGDWPITLRIVNDVLTHAITVK
jgi:hypothetical protein